MKVAYITFHQGYTDSILCIGLIFYNLEKYDKIILVVLNRLSEMFEFIFREEKRIIIHYFRYRYKRLLYTINKQSSYTNSDDKIDYLTYGRYRLQRKKKRGSFLLI